MRNPPFAFPAAGTRFILLTAHPDGRLTVKTNDPLLSDPAETIAALRHAADLLAAGESGAVLL